MSLLIEIEGKEYEGKCNFAFDRYTDAKFGEVDENGQKQGGFHNLYSRLLELEPKALVDFWEAALAHLGKKKPTTEAIEKALEERIEEDEDVFPAIQEAFNEIDNSGFFKRKAKSFWKDVELMKEIGGQNEEEAKKVEIAYKRMIEAKKELKPTSDETNG